MGRNKQGLIRPFESELGILFRLADGIIIAGLLLLASSSYGGHWADRDGIAAAIAVFLYYLLAEHQHLYRSWRYAPIRNEIASVFWIWSWVVALMLFLWFFMKISSDYSRLVIMSWLATVPVALSMWRLVVRGVLRTAREHNANTRSAVIVGAGVLGCRFAKEISALRWTGVRLAGFYDDHKTKGTCPLPGSTIQVRGTIDELLEVAHRDNIDIVYIALPNRAQGRIQKIVKDLADTTASVYLLPDVFVSDLMHATWTNIGDIPVVSIYESPFDGVTGWVKRIEDILLSVLILTFAAIPMMVIALAVKATSPGKAIFKQRRYGLDGDVVMVWKFRTMSVCEDGDDIKQATKGDGRITPLGAFLRRTSLDELPQFINVLQGHMSIVGPRPHAVAHNEQYRRLIHGYMLRHKVKPGITGWAQVNGFRGETETLDKMEKRVQYDLDYIRSWSLWLDMKIILMTAFGLGSRKNAY